MNQSKLLAQISVRLRKDQLESLKKLVEKGYFSSVPEALRFACDILNTIFNSNKNLLDMFFNYVKSKYCIPTIEEIEKLSNTDKIYVIYCEKCGKVLGFSIKKSDIKKLRNKKCCGEVKTKVIVLNKNFLSYLYTFLNESENLLKTIKDVGNLNNNQIEMVNYILKNISNLKNKLRKILSIDY